jgi:hypothetical protein
LQFATGSLPAAFVCCGLRGHRVYSRQSVQLLENDPDEILDVVKEMFQRLDGVVAYTEADEHRQRRFVELRHLQDECPAPTLTRVGRDYLRKHEKLLR